MNKLTVVIVSYRVPQYLEQCILSVVRATEGIGCEIVVVDNHSNDGTVEYLKERFEGSITLVESNHNLGFSKANNIAIRQTQSQYVLLLNPDTFVGEDSLHQVLTFMDEHPLCGGVGVMMHNADGSVARESRRGIPTPWVALQKMLGRSSRYYMSHLPWDRPGQIEAMSGAFCMLRREALDKVGLLDEDFFMYGEDIDLSYRLLRGGYENWYVPARIVHYKGESTQKSSFRYVHVFYQAMLIFFRKHYAHASWFVTLPIKTGIYLRALLALFQMMCDNIRQSLGFIDNEGAQPEYVFVGSATMLDECRQLTRRKGLNANLFLNDDAKLNLNDNTNEAMPQPDSRLCIVYDTDTFSFEQIIDMAAKNSPARIGTFSAKTHTLITSSEIIR
jgi:GT2 family glycosyltransferase